MVFWKKQNGRDRKQLRAKAGVREGADPQGGGDTEGEEIRWTVTLGVL